MIRRSFRIGLSLGLLTGLVLALTKVLQHRRAAAPGSAGSGGPWEPLAPVTPPPAPRPEPQADPERPLRVDRDVPREAPPARTDANAARRATKQTSKKAAKTATSKAAHAAWVDPGTGGACPASHPVKAKLSSRIFHLPGMLNYDRTKADRCYLDAAAAEGDGLRASKR
ncbi:hypothetical protein BH20ACT2_BH20ACT2_05670 [soil metagenome]